MRHFAIMLLLLSSLNLWGRCDDGYFIQNNGCFLEVLCVNGTDSLLVANFHLQSLGYTQKNTDRFELRDGNGTTFMKSLNDFPQFASITDLAAFIDPLRDACQGSGGGGGTVTVTTRDVERVKMCDVTGGVLNSEFYRTNIYNGQTGAFISSTLTNADGSTYTLVGTEVDCGEVCLVQNQTELIQVIGGVLTIPANTVASVAFTVTTGNAVITIDGGTAITVSAGEISPDWHARECDYLEYEIIIDTSAGGTAFVTTIK